MLVYKVRTVNQYRAQLMWLATHSFGYRTLSAYLMPTLSTLEGVLLAKTAKFKVGSVKC